MKKLTLLLTIILLTNVLLAEDILVLNNGKAFKGEIKKIKNCTLIFKTNGEKYEISSSDIYIAKFENPNSKILTDYINLGDSDKCLRGVNDSEKYNKRSVNYLLAGVVFGPMAVIVASTDKINIKKEMCHVDFSSDAIYNDPEYLKCYKKRSKQKNIGNALFGWFAWIVIVLSFATSA